MRLSEQLPCGGVSLIISAPRAGSPACAAAPGPGAAMDGTQGVRVGRQDNKPGRREARQEAGWAPAAAAQPQVRRSCAPTARAAARACRAFACASRAHTHTARANTEPRDGVRGAREGHCQPPDRSSSKLFEALRRLWAAWDTLQSWCRAPTACPIGHDVSVPHMIKTQP